MPLTILYRNRWLITATVEFSPDPSYAVIEVRDGQKNEAVDLEKYLDELEHREESFAECLETERRARMVHCPRLGA